MRKTEFRNEVMMVHFGIRVEIQRMQDALASLVAQEKQLAALIYPSSKPSVPTSGAEK